jgi:hypothetical protein
MTDTGDHAAWAAEAIAVFHDAAARMTTQDSSTTIFGCPRH